MAVLPQVKADRLRALGVNSAKRSAAAPDLLTPAELNNSVRNEFVKYSKVIKDNGINADRASPIF